MKTRKKVHRYWLNPKDSEDTGHIKTFVHATVSSRIDAKGKKTVDFDIDADIHLADCSRKITLNLGVYEYGKPSKRKIEERLKKIDLLINTLTKFREEFVEATEFVDEHTRN